jgi:NADH:ubiquinone reductase (H+-translocating)
VVAPTDYFLYLPLLPEVAAGILEPRRITVSLAATLPGVRLVLGNVDGIDVESREVSLVNPEGERHDLGYDRLVLAAGSVNKLLPVPGVPEHAHGFRGVPEAIYLRDHLVRQVELAAGTDDPAECRARCTVVVVGAGYTGRGRRARQAFHRQAGPRPPLPGPAPGPVDAARPGAAGPARARRAPRAHGGLRAARA